MSSADTPSPTVTDDDQSRARLDALVTELGDDAVASEITRTGDSVVRVTAAAWARAAVVCRSQGYDYFCFLSGIDWMPSTSPNPRASVSDELDTGDDDAPAAAVDDEEAAPEAEAEPEVEVGGLGYPTGVGGGDTRFQVFARLYSTARHEGVTLKADLDPDDPRVGTWSNVYPGADWNERETWEMYGFVFDGHPHLVKLYLPGEFEGFPLRKDFPLLSREVKPWPGLVDVEPMPEVPGADDAPTDAPAGEVAPAEGAPAAPTADSAATTDSAATEPAAEPTEPPADTDAAEQAPESAAETETAAAPAADTAAAEQEPESAADTEAAETEAAATEPAPEAAATEPATEPAESDGIPESAEEAHATGTESATTTDAAEAPAIDNPEDAG